MTAREFPHAASAFAWEAVRVEHEAHEHQQGHAGPASRAAESAHAAAVSPSATRVAISATLHCLTGCAIGEVLGLALGTWWAWSNGATITLAIALAFFFGYALSMTPLIRGGLSFRKALGIALAADTISIATMEVVDNAVVLAVPGAMDAGLNDLLFWGSLMLALAIAFVVTVPVNRALILRGKGHAVVHHLHH